MRIDYEFVRYPGIEIPVALGCLVEADHLDVNDLADREPAALDCLHQLSVVLQHRGLPGVPTVGFCPTEAEAQAQHSTLCRLLLCTGVIGHVEPGNADRTGRARDLHQAIQHDRRRFDDVTIRSLAFGLEADAIDRTVDLGYRESAFRARGHVAAYAGARLP